MLLGLAAGFTTLGVWQLQRRVWKLHLIARIEQRIHAPASAAPGPAAWPSITAKTDAYRRVRVAGVLLVQRQTFVQAVTERGAGYWVLTPMRTDQGFIILINRGFVQPDRRDAARGADAQARADVTGLLRVTEPGGGFLRVNDPESERWYSRDVAAIAIARHLRGVAPYFIDAEAGGAAGSGPVPGLTIVALPNSHLVYAITWFALAAITLAALVAAHRRERHGEGPTNVLQS